MTTLNAPHVARAAAASLALCAVARADVVDATYFSPTSFSCRVTHMPDFDQLRIELPSNGNWYCVPSSTTNMLAFAANHGFPAQFPYGGDWQSQANYARATSAISLAGAFMGTLPDGGTGSAGWYAGTNALLWLLGGSVTDPPLCHHHFYQTGDYRIRLHKMAKATACGGIASFAIGSYAYAGVGDGTFVFGDRVGGHIVTLAEAGPAMPFAPYFVMYRDPADSPADSMQSAFVSRYSEVHSPWVRWIQFEPFEVDTIDWDPSQASGVMQVIDEFVVLRPAGLLQFTQSGGLFTLASAAAGAFGPTAPPVTLGGTVAGIADLAFDADALDAFALVQTSVTGGATQLRRVNMANGAQSVLSTLTGLRRIASERNGCIYAIDATTVMCLRPDGGVAASTAKAGAPSALAADDGNHEVVVLSIDRRRLVRLGHDMSVRATFEIPAAVPLAGEAWVTVDPSTGAVYFASEAGNGIYALAPGWGPGDLAGFTVTGVAAPRNLSAADNGRLFVTTQGSVRMLVRDELGRWSVDAASPFHMQQVSSRVSPMRSRTNRDPALHGPRDWFETPPALYQPSGTPVPDCIADLNGDGTVSADDLARLLSNWGRSPRMTGLSVSFDYVGNTVGSWASDMIVAVSDGARSSVHWGGYDLAHGGIFGGQWPFYGASSAANGRYSATVSVPASAMLAGAGPWTVTVLNGWGASPAVEYRNVRVQPQGAALAPIVPVGSHALAGGQSVAVPFGFTAIEGDLNADGTVDAADLTQMLSSWGPCVR